MTFGVLGHHERRADRRVPDADAQREKEQGECEIPPTTAADEHGHEQHGGGAHARERETGKEQLQGQMTLCSRVSSPSAKRLARRGVRSTAVRPSTTSCAMSSPIAGACMTP